MSDNGSKEEVATRRVGKLTFQIFKRDSPRRSDPSVTLERTGRISVNGEAARQLGKPSELELMYDPQYRAIGLWAAKERTENTFRALTARGANVKTSDGFNVSAIKFCKHINLDVPESRRFKPVIEDGVLYFFLDQGVSVSTRRKQPKP